MLTIKKILKEVGNKNLDLNRWDEAYFTFTYDNGVRFEQHSVTVCRVNDMSLEHWVATARAFLEKIGEV